MSRALGAARQNGMIVADLDRAIDHFVETLGAGPFFVIRHVPLEYFTYHGRPSEPDISIALGNMGELQLELIEQHNEAPSPYRHFAEIKKAGLHHISAWTDRFDGVMGELRERERMPDCEGAILGGARFAYFGCDAVDGSAFEISDLGAQNEFGAIHDLVREAALNWDGAEPLRQLG